jgi:hypothetical protein
MNCPTCGRRVKLERSLLGGKRIPWHKPKRGAPASAAYPAGMGSGMSGYCQSGGRVLSEPQ